jgi:hypothetical protein
MNNQETNSLDLDTINRQLAIAEAQEKETEAKLEANRKFRQQLLAEQDRLLNDPKERAKMFADANSKIEAGISDYNSKGYSCEVVRDENGMLIKILFKTIKTGSRGLPNKTTSAGSIPAMTFEDFADVYESLGEEFNNKDIIQALTSKSTSGESNFRTQPVLGKILKDGFKKIRILKIGEKGRGVKYKKIAQANL